MYAHLKGKLISKKAPWLVLDVNGMGYEIQVPMTVYFALPELGEQLFLFTHYIVREDAQSLYGFIKIAERDLFREIIRVSGIGPKVALSILSTLPVSDFVHCIENSKIDLLTQIPGIGKKTAERLLIELRDRLKLFDLANHQVSTGMQSLVNSAQTDAIQALMSLGYNAKEAKSAVSHAAVDVDCETILRGALQRFAK